MKLEQYPKYKESGIPWVGAVPDSWTVNRAKWYIKSPKELNSNEQCKQVLSLTLRGVVDNDPENPEGLVPKDYKTYQIFEKDDLVFKLIDLENVRTSRAGLVHKRGIMSPAYIRASMNKGNNSKYFYYLYYSWYLQNVYNKLGAGVRATLSAKDLLNLPITLPTQEEQRAIASFIRSKEKKIGQFIRNKRRLIQLLKEQKQAIINQAVIRGISPNVKMKPSGIHYLGDIPEHWDVAPLRSLGQFQNGISESAEYFGSGYPFVSYGDIYKNMVLPLEVEGLARSSDDERRRLSVEEGDVFFTRTSETIEEIGISSVCMNSIKDAVFSGFIIRFRPVKKVITKEFSKYYFRSYIAREYFVREMNIVTRASLAQDLLKGLPVLLPSPSEQKEIFNFLEKKSMQIDLAIEKAHCQIELVQEYRTRLISDVVTGKVDVRDIKVEDVADEELADVLDSSEEKEELEDSIGEVSDED